MKKSCCLWFSKWNLVSSFWSNKIVKSFFGANKKWLFQKDFGKEEILLARKRVTKITLFKPNQNLWLYSLRRVNTTKCTPSFYMQGFWLLLALNQTLVLDLIKIQQLFRLLRGDTLANNTYKFIEYWGCFPLTTCRCHSTTWTMTNCNSVVRAKIVKMRFFQRLADLCILNEIHEMTVMVWENLYFHHNISTLWYNDRR